MGLISTLQPGLYQLCLSWLHQRAVLQIASLALSNMPCSQGQRLIMQLLHLMHFTSTAMTALQLATPDSSTDPK